MNTRDSSVYTVHENDNGRRVDRVLRKMYPTLPLSVIYKMIRKGDVRVDGKRTKADAHLEAGSTIRVRGVPEPAQGDILPGGISSGRLHHAKEAPETIDPAAARSRLKGLVIYSDEHVLAINKPYGMLVHGPESLDTLVRSSTVDRPNGSLSFVPGPVHRIDRNTTGLVLFSNSLIGAQTLTAALRERTCGKYYIALLAGHLPDRAEWEDRLERSDDERTTVAAGAGTGKNAITRVEPLASASGMTLVICTIVTGRTHQIRAQASIHGFPLAGDRKYGGGHSPRHYVLHAAGIRLSGGIGSGRSFFFAPFSMDTMSLLSAYFDDDEIQRSLERVKSLLSDGTL